tara:strand:+ start:555 stop:791 length:237 start_codon:yes stop_codon:yes gene_type:complete
MCKKPKGTYIKIKILIRGEDIKDIASEKFEIEYFITSQIVVNNKGIMIIALSLWCTQCFFPEKFICNIIYLYYFYKPN